MLVVAAESAEAVQPPEGPFDDPAFRQDREGGGSFVARDDLKRGATFGPQISHPLDQAPSIAAVSPNAAQPTEALSQRLQQQMGAITVLDAGGVNADQKDQSQRVDQDVSLSSKYLLASIIAANSSLLSCSHTLRVEYRSSRGFFLPWRSRTASRSASLSDTQTPCFFQWSK